MIWITTMLEHADLRTAHAIAAIGGMMLSVLSMYNINPNFRMVTHYAYRVGFACIALALLWIFSYAQEKNWQPWPPQIALMAAVDYFLFVRLWHKKHSIA
jgi:cell division protein FtsW (lipid II flippase)